MALHCPGFIYEEMALLCFFSISTKNKLNSRIFCTWRQVSGTLWDLWTVIVFWYHLDSSQFRFTEQLNMMINNRTTTYQYSCRWGKSSLFHQKDQTKQIIEVDRSSCSRSRKYSDRSSSKPFFFLNCCYTKNIHLKKYTLKSSSLSSFTEI